MDHSVQHCIDTLPDARVWEGAYIPCVGGELRADLKGKEIIHDRRRT